jgi:ribose 5-phosphate isomerase B
MTIYLASDHAGFEMRGTIRAGLLAHGYVVEDCGAPTYDPDDDYPDFISLAAAKVSADPAAKAVILGGSGQGEAIVANRFANVRAVVYYGGPEEILTLSREHNNANVLSLGARFVSPQDVVRLVLQWLNTDYSGGERHARRILKIERYS